ncbi:basic salivary proline-rich protein 3-like [Pseudopipra pipra]|uniref:basic salivary proline-rich protein 3-like n=1 Tax=Pseudopipra pipra TaxID=415032 RepID=UPI003139079B
MQSDSSSCLPKRKNPDLGKPPRRSRRVFHASLLPAAAQALRGVRRGPGTGRAARERGGFPTERTPRAGPATVPHIHGNSQIPEHHLRLGGFTRGLPGSRGDRQRPRSDGAAPVAGPGHRPLRGTRRRPPVPGQGYSPALPTAGPGPGCEPRSPLPVLPQPRGHAPAGAPTPRSRLPVVGGTAPHRRRGGPQSPPPPAPVTPNPAAPPHPGDPAVPGARRLRRGRAPLTPPDPPRSPLTPPPNPPRAPRPPPLALTAGSARAPRRAAPGRREGRGGGRGPLGSAARPARQPPVPDLLSAWLATRRRTTNLLSSQWHPPPAPRRTRPPANGRAAPRPPGPMGGRGDGSARPPEQGPIPERPRSSGQWGGRTGNAGPAPRRAAGGGA